MEYLGNCVDSFDSDGECVVNELPWLDVSGFACDVEDLGDNFELEGIRVVYCEHTDIHTFYRV